MRIPCLVLLLVAGLGDAPAAQAEWPEWMDRWLYNAEERTRRGARSMQDKDHGQAAAAMDTAMRLAPDDPGATFNAGTARLPLAPEEGRRLLEDAGAQDADPTLASRAFYNAGNSFFEGADYEAAIDAYKNSLRRDPAFEDAKFNLELAQRKLREQQQQNQDQENQDQQNQDQENQDQQNQDQQNQDQENQDQQNQNQENQDQQNQDQEQQNQDQEGQDQEQQDQEQDQGQEPQDQDPQQNQDQQEQQPQDGSGSEQQESPLPQFQDLEDMSAEEAAAILEAIENMEREQRRQEALEAAKANVGGKKDW